MAISSVYPGIISTVTKESPAALLVFHGSVPSKVDFTDIELACRQTFSGKS